VCLWFFPVAADGFVFVATVHADGFRAGQSLALTVPVTAAIRGFFFPEQPDMFGGDVRGLFVVRRASLPIYERVMFHRDVPEFWRGFVDGFEDGRT